MPDEHQERAVYVRPARIVVDAGARTGQMLVCCRAARTPRCVATRADARVMLLGGAPLDGERHIFWNFVASTPERIEQAQERLEAGPLPEGPRRRLEYIPLPE